MNFCIYENRAYVPMLSTKSAEITADSELLAESGDRLMFVHDRNGSKLFVAPKGTQYSGFVLGLFIE